MSNTTNDPAAQYGDKPTEPFASFLEAIKQAATVAACAALVRDKITSGELIKPDMFFDYETGLVTLRILDTQWTMDAQDLMSRLNRFKDDHHLSGETLSTADELSVSMRIVMACGSQIVKP